MTRGRFFSTNNNKSKWEDPGLKMKGDEKDKTNPSFFIYVSVRGWRCFQKGRSKIKKEMEGNVVQLYGSQRMFKRKRV